jgi:tetratricopeptide (TPR) repeat protein
MADMDQFLISDEAIQKMNDEEMLNRALEEGKTFQELFGFSDAIVVEFYEAAKNVLEQNRFEDAVSAFLFLTGLNPNVADFWMGMGMAQQKNNEFDAALNSYTIAIELEGNKIFPYILTAQCCMEIKNFQKALEVIESAEKYAQEKAAQEDTKQLQSDAVAAKQYVRQQQRKHI